MLIAPNYKDNIKLNEGTYDRRSYQQIFVEHTPSPGGTARAAGHDDPFAVCKPLPPGSPLAIGNNRWGTP
jgi:hypothetical protein